MKKILSTLLILAVFVGMFTVLTITASADETASQDGIELSIATDKDNYKSGEDINVTITVKNNNTYDVNGLNLWVEAPEGLSIKSGDLSKNIDLAAGAELTNQVSAVETPDDNNNSGDNTGSESNPKTGDTSFVLLAVLMAVSAAGIVLAVKHRKNSTKVMSLVLCVLMAAAVIPFSAFAEEHDSVIGITVNKTITVDGDKFEIKATLANIAGEYAVDMFFFEGTLKLEENGKASVITTLGDPAAHWRWRLSVHTPPRATRRPACSQMAS